MSLTIRKSALRKALKALGLLLIFAAIIFAYYLFLVDHRRPIKMDVGDFFGHSSALTPLYADFELRYTQIEMKDGIKLAADYYLPTTPINSTLPTGTQEKFPVILAYTPYGRSQVVLDMPLWQRVASKLTSGFWGPAYGRGLSKRARVFMSQGYVYIAADMRGGGASGGTHTALDPQFGKDGKELVDWIADQPWSNGKVCMEGQSYNAWSQYSIASQRPDALKCISPALIVSEVLTESNRPGGITAISWLNRYSDLVKNITSFAPDQDAQDKFNPPTPIVDEDGDGSLADEVPLSIDGDTPIYRDHQNRTDHHYAKAMLERKDNLLPAYFMSSEYAEIDATISHKGRTFSYADLSPGRMLTDIKDSGIAIYHQGGWFDGFLRGTAKLYGTTQKWPNTKLIIAPRFHLPGGVTRAYAEYFGYEGSGTDQFIYESLRFFDYHLKGKKNGIGTEKPVKLYVMNEGWREENEWPLARQEITPFYFGAEQTLATSSASENGADTYQVDWTHASDYGGDKLNRWTMVQGIWELMDRTEHDKKTYTYDTPVLTEDTEVTGHPIINLWVSSNQADADVHVYLTDVDGNGRSLYVTEGHLRAGWAALHDDDDQFENTIDVKPDLPWHGFRKGGYDPAPMGGGKTVNLRFDLYPTSWVFKKGHKIRVSIAGTDTGNFQLNKTPCPTQEVASCTDTQLTFHRAAGMLSNIELPIIPKKRAYAGTR